MEILFFTRDGNQLFRMDNITSVGVETPIELECNNIRSFSKWQSFTAECSGMPTPQLMEILNPISNPTYEVEGVVNRIQKRRHKKHRINKKWAKRYGYWYIVCRGNMRRDIKLNVLPDKPESQMQFTIDNVRFHIVGD